MEPKRPKLPATLDKVVLTPLDDLRDFSEPAAYYLKLGNDFVSVSLFDDFVFAGGDADQIEGRDGDDVLMGQRGNDSVYGGAGDDFIDGGTDDDVLGGRTGNDVLIGGDGNDVIDADDVGFIGGPPPGRDQLFGGDGNDSLDGGAGRDRLYGGRGRDTIDGGSGNDRHWGGGGADMFEIGPGRDHFRGGKGGDSYVIGFDAGTKNVIHDFCRLTDTLDIGGPEVAASPLIVSVARVKKGVLIELDLADPVAVELRGFGKKGFALEMIEDFRPELWIWEGPC